MLLDVIVIIVRFVWNVVYKLWALIVTVSIDRRLFIQDLQTKLLHCRLELPSILQIDGNGVESVDSFVYLGSLQKSEDNSCPDMKRRISLAGWQHQSCSPYGVTRSFSWALRFACTRPLWCPFCYMLQKPGHYFHCQVGLASGRSLGRDWRRRPGGPRARWTDQLRTDTGSVPVNLWRQATLRGHGGATRQPELATRWRRDDDDDDDVARRHSAKIPVRVGCELRHKIPAFNR